MNRMNDLISRQAAIDVFKRELTTGESNGKYVTTCCAIGYDGIKQILESISSVQPERKRGKWKTAYLDHEAFGVRPEIFYCSNCNRCSAFPTNFCPDCGSDNRGAKDEAN